MESSSGDCWDPDQYERFGDHRRPKALSAAYSRQPFGLLAFRRGFAVARRRLT